VGVRAAPRGNALTVVRAMSTENTNARLKSPSKLGGASAPQKEFVCCRRDGSEREEENALASLCILASLAFCQIICSRCCLSKLLGGWLTAL